VSWAHPSSLGSQVNGFIPTTGAREESGVDHGDNDDGGGDDDDGNDDDDGGDDDDGNNDGDGASDEEQPWERPPRPEVQPSTPHRRGSLELYRCFALSFFLVLGYAHSYNIRAA
jgi:hypothetical protein